MTDQAVVEEVRRRTPAEADRGIVPDPRHEDVVRAIRELARQETAVVRTKVATVISETAGRVRVQLDDEQLPRQVGIAKAAGVRFLANDRVFVHQIGKELILGGRVAQSAFDPAVGVNELVSGSVDDRVLGSGPSSRISTAQSTASSAQSAASSAQSAANSAQSAANSAQSTANSAYSLASSANGLANSAYSLASTANNTANNASNKADNAINRIQCINNRWDVNGGAGGYIRIAC